MASGDTLSVAKIRAVGFTPSSVKNDFKTQIQSTFKEAVEEAIEDDEENQKQIKTKGQQLVKEHIDENSEHYDYYMDAKMKLFDILDPETKRGW